MAKLDGNFGFNGPLGNVSAYKMRGVDGIILRRKGGASKEKIKTSPKMAGTRQANAEFGGRANAGKWIRRLLFHQTPMAGYNITGAINALMAPIQQLDTENRQGQRNVVLSKNPRLLEGFSLNREQGFDTIIRNPLSWSISREALSARIELPALLPGINFLTVEKYPMYSIIATLGIAPDFFYTKHGYTPSSRDYHENDMQVAKTDWYPVLQGSPATSLEIKLPNVPPDQSFSLVLSIGLCFGAMQNASTITQVRRAGAAKILGMG
jgi:hypothetical protein